MLFVIPPSFDLEPDFAMPTQMISADLAPDLSAGRDPGQGIDRVFRKPFLLDSFCHDFEKVDEGQKPSSQMWISMEGDIIYIFSTYGFSLSFVSLKTQE